MPAFASYPSRTKKCMVWALAVLNLQLVEQQRNLETLTNIYLHAMIMHNHGELAHWCFLSPPVLTAEEGL